MPFNEPYSTQHLIAHEKENTQKGFIYYELMAQDYPN